MSADASRPGPESPVSVSMAAHCVLFDLDGTLVDTAPDLAFAANGVRADLGLDALPMEAYRPLASSGARGMLGKALGIQPGDPHYDLRRDRFLDLYRANLSRGSRLFPEMEQFLHHLQQQGRPWGIVTNKVSGLTLPLLDALGLARRAACVVCADQVAQPKPAPDSLLLAMKQVQVAAAETVYIGDDRRDVVAARAAGLRSVAAGWGYLGNEEPISAWGADLIVDTVADLARVLG